MMLQTEEDRANLDLFEALFLGLGPAVVKLDGSRHDAELLRETAILAARPKERGYAPGDEFIADSLVERQAEAYRVQTDEMASSLEYIREEAKKERKLLPSFVVRNGVRREER